MYLKRKAALLAVALILAPISVFAITIHTSTEDFYSNGATKVGNCTGVGCTSSSFTFGTPSGTVLWEIKEQVSTNQFALGTTTFTWNVLNDNFTPTPLNNITSFGISANGVASLLPGQPAGWTFNPVLAPPGFWYWDTNALVTGIPAGGFPNLGTGVTFTMTLLGTNFGVTFAPTEADLGLAHTPQTGNPWMASAPLLPAVPEPGTLSLLGTGLLGVGAFVRRKLRHPGEAKA